MHLDENPIYEAEEWIQKAIEAFKTNGIKWHLGRGYALYAKFYKRKGELSKAEEKLSLAIEIFKECGADGWVRKYKKELSAL